jgi:hypothetical protein
MNQQFDKSSDSVGRPSQIFDGNVQDNTMILRLVVKYSL